MRRRLLAATRLVAGARWVGTSPNNFPTPKVTVVYKPKAIDDEIARVFYNRDDGRTSDHPSPSSPVRLIGFDIEHKPETKKGAPPSVHLVQLTSPCGREALLLHVGAAGLATMSFDRLRQTVPHFATLLRDENVVAAGVGVRGDCDRLKGSHLFFFEGDRHGCDTTYEGNTFGSVSSQASTVKAHMKTLDSQVVHLFYHPNEVGAGVAKLAAFHGVPASAQNKSVTMSDWSLAPLTERQVRYAAEDAWLSFQIAKAQFTMYGESHGLPFETWAGLFQGVDTPLAMDARVEEILRVNKGTDDGKIASHGTEKGVRPHPASWQNLPDTVLALFRKHHGVVTKLRELRDDALRWRAVTTTVAKYLLQENGFRSPVSALEIVGAHSKKAPDENKRHMAVTYTHSVEQEIRTKESAGDGSSFVCVARVALPGTFSFEKTLPVKKDFREKARVAKKETALSFVGRGRTKRVAKETAAAGVLAKLIGTVQGHWVCSNAVEWLVAQSKEQRARVIQNGGLECGANGCVGAGSALAGPRDRHRSGNARPAHFGDDAGWVSCAERLKRIG